jgi:two-component system chemotaxis response regulator CheY
MSENREEEMTAKILIVDDSAAIRTSITYVLELSGYSVATAENGLIAIRQADKTDFDLIITDVMMPQADGFETIKAFREISHDIPIIAMSGRFTPGGADFLEMARELGANIILRKPFGGDELLTVIHKLLNHRDRTTAQAPTRQPQNRFEGTVRIDTKNGAALP